MSLDGSTPRGLSSSRTRRLIALVALAAFAGFGVFYFGPRMPREMQVRFELPPTLRGEGLMLPREDARSLSAKVFDEARQPVGVVEVSLAGLAGPRTGAFVMNLKPGLYAFDVEVEGGGLRVPMHAFAELDGDPVAVDLKAGRARQ